MKSTSFLGICLFVTMNQRADGVLDAVRVIFYRDWSSTTKLVGKLMDSSQRRISNVENCLDPFKGLAHLASISKNFSAEKFITSEIDLSELRRT